MYNFNENNIVAGYIKELLHNFNLPTCEVFLPNQTVVFPETNYIYNNFIVKTRSSISVGKRSSLAFNEYDVVVPYYYNKKVYNLTKNLKLNSIIYDRYTHEYLGNYLRFYRDFMGIDLMMLYNCFSNYQVSNLLYGDFDAEDLDYKIYAVPIKFNRKYLIGIDSDTKVELVCGLFTDDYQITTLNTKNSTKIDSLYNYTYQAMNGTKFNSPFEFSVDILQLDNQTTFKRYESCLKLFIKVPVNNKSSIAVVETLGNAAQFKVGVDGGIADLKLINGEPLLTDLPTKLSLFKINDGMNYPFADRLVEFLFGQVIDANEQIGENIEGVQQQLLSVAQEERNKVRLRHVKYFGVWSDNIRDTCYRATLVERNDREIKYLPSGEVGKQKYINTVYDLTGYVDKDIEALITVVPE